MKCAMFPGQREALSQRAAQLRADGQRRINRRTILGVGLGGFFGLTSGSLATLGVTARAMERPEQQPSPELAWARELAVGGLDELLGAQARYVRALDQATENDEVLWVGVTRLSNAVLDRHPLVQPALAGSLRPLAERHDVPAVVRRLLGLVAGR